MRWKGITKNQKRSYVYRVKNKQVAGCLCAMVYTQICMFLVTG